MSTNTGLQSIEQLASSAPGDTDEACPAHRELRDARAAERVRMRHVCRALAGTEGAKLRQRWQSEMEDCLARVWDIEHTLRTDAMQGDQHTVDKMNECLLEAMELARASMALVELRCLQIRRGRSRAPEWSWNDWTEMVK